MPSGGQSEAERWRERLTWLAHMRRETILQWPRAFSVRLAQPRLRQISNRQRMRRPALSRMYWMSLPRDRPSSFSPVMYDCTTHIIRQPHTTTNETGQKDPDQVLNIKDLPCPE